jgi:hypothetical protein
MLRAKCGAMTGKGPFRDQIGTALRQLFHAMVLAFDRLFQWRLYLDAYRRVKYA